MTSCDKVRVVVEQLATINPHTNAKDLPDAPRPDESSIPRNLPSLQQLPYVQNVLNVLSYNFLPQTFFCLEKHRSLQSIMMTSKEILAEALPIRCLEATFVGLYLTQAMKNVDRIPVSFKSRVKGHSYHHIVLVIRCDSLYGALGLSRKATLMDKPVTYRRLFDLIMEYKKQYEAIGHELVDFKLGLCVSHEAHSRKVPCWRYISVKLGKMGSPSSSASPQSGGEVEAGEPGDCTAEACSRDGVGSVADVELLLACYAALLTTMSEQYDRYAASYALGSARQLQPTSLKDLNEIEETTAREENKRRLEELRCGRSPCAIGDAGTKKRAASRSVSKKRGDSTFGGTMNTTITTTTSGGGGGGGSSSCAARNSYTGRTTVATKKTPKKESLVSTQKTYPSQQHQQQQQDQLPLVATHASSVVSVPSLNGSIGSGGGTAHRCSQSNSLSPFAVPPLLPLLAKSGDMTSLADLPQDYWAMPVLPVHSSEEANLHNLW
ncbi:vasohibin-1 [Trypanosoma grayi]|uniref:vasohibin-1 n=1 Tax=Trypanosoma grayi TaxID=71804 RepID=UPI0004F43CB1|nr:vasohibin-1 [Trypanosoma grayi]KEG15111.1 vasohibin-1 [Trypanosoma grayi]